MRSIACGLAVLTASCAPMLGSDDGGRGCGGGTGGASTGGGTAGGYGTDLCVNAGPGSASVLDASGAAQTTPLIAVVTVLAADSGVFVVDGGAAGLWTVAIDALRLPANLLTVGETVELDVSASVDLTQSYPTVTQDVALSRAGQLIAFGASLESMAVGPPDLRRHGLVVVDDGVTCESTHTIIGCARRLHRARFSIAGETAVAHPGQTVNAGRYVFSLGEWVERFGGACDTKDNLRFGGYRTP